MLNSEPIETGTEDAFEPHTLTRAGGSPAGGSQTAGAVVLAGLATFVVVALWFAFYLLVFVPRAGAP
jgi:hypothetical protein